MKRSTLIVSVFLLSIFGVPSFVHSQGSWIAQNSGTSQDLFDIHLVDNMTGWAVGSGGTILFTSDGGVQWTRQSSPSTNGLKSVYFVNSDNGWIVGDGGTILRTTNRGSVWSQQVSPTTNNLESLHFVDANNGWAVGMGDPFEGHGTVIHTSDGGLNWVRQTNVASNTLTSTFFVDSETGWAVGTSGIGHSGAAIHTSNGGDDWTSQTIVPDNWLYSVCFVDSVSGWATGEGGTILRTTNAGDEWILEKSPVASLLLGVQFIDSTTGWIVGDEGGILHTIDGGVTWNIQVTSTSNTLRSVFFTDKDDGWAVGYSGTILHTTTGGTPPPTRLVTVDAEIDSLHQFVPAEGDTFAFRLTFENLTTDSQFVNYWTKVLRPNGKPPIDPSNGPYAPTIAPLQTIVIDTINLGVPFNAISGDYSLIAYIGTYNADTLDTDTTYFTKLEGIPCDSIDTFQARCLRSGLLQARVVFFNSTRYAGDHVIIRVDSTDYPVVIITNGIHSRAQFQITEGTGNHTVNLVSPPQCFAPIFLSCSGSGDDAGWELDEFLGGRGPSSLLPDRPVLFGNFPNPFNPSTTFRYSLSEPGQVTLRIYNTLGQLVQTLVDDFQSEGYHEVVWNGTNQSGISVSSGVYLYRMVANKLVETRKLLVVK